MYNIGCHALCCSLRANPDLVCEVYASQLTATAFVDFLAVALTSKERQARDSSLLQVAVKNASCTIVKRARARNVNVARARAIMPTVTFGTTPGCNDAQQLQNTRFGTAIRVAWPDPSLGDAVRSVRAMHKPWMIHATPSPPQTNHGWKGIQQDLIPLAHTRTSSDPSTRSDPRCGTDWFEKARHIRKVCICRWGVEANCADPRNWFEQ